MNLKFVVLCVCLAVVSAVNIPAVDDLREAFETEDSLFIPISDVEAEQLRLPRSSHIPEKKLPQFEEDTASDDWETAQLRQPRGIPNIEYHHQHHHKHKRPHRSLDEAFETEDAYYIPMSDEEVDSLRLPRSLDELQKTIESEGLTDNVESGRAKRQIFAQGGGSPGKGYDIYAQGRAKLWESQNQRNSLHGTASYSQHLGGPYGNSRPNVGAGLIFTHRF